MNHHYCMHVFWIFPKQCVHTERVSYGRCNGRCFIRAHSGLRHFTCKFQYKVAVVKSWHTFRPRRLAQSVCVGVCVCVRVLGSIWARHFTCKFPYRVVLVKFWHAFRLRRLAQNVCPCSGLILGLKCVLLGASFLSELVSFLVEFRIESGLASSL